ncbi:MAG TPA: bifunctional diguanylate cyclase/phosphodiesterase [Steroidobacteraceae bacterium]|nr:bifunctional diguanylate cyclase/phosphodiesterase [Steroidobacteraceae bacterium]
MKSNAATRPGGSDSAFDSYVQIARSLRPTISDVCLLAASWEVRGCTRALDMSEVTRACKSLGESAGEQAICALLPGNKWLSLIALAGADGRRLGFLCVQETLPRGPSDRPRQAQEVRKALAPLLACLRRDLASGPPSAPRARARTERAAELEWLFKLTTQLHSSLDDGRLIERLIEAAGERLGCGFGALFVPGKRLCVERCFSSSDSAVLTDSWARVKQPVLTWVQRQNKPLMANRSSGTHAGRSPCKILAVPVPAKSGRVIGALTFLGTEEGEDFTSRELFLARHLGRQAGQLVEMQFDLMTGLYTRRSIEERAERTLESGAAQEHCIVYFDVDHMHLINELYGFELGAELIVRIAELMAQPLLPDCAIAARIDTDRFVALLPGHNAQQAVEVAERIRQAASRLTLGPIATPADVSLSGGVAQLIPVPMAFQHALSAAELACKTAKSRGRNRVELYALEDESMMRRHGNVIAIGRLREALNGDRLLLYAQPIVSLRKPGTYLGYEILLRLRTEEGGVETPGEIVEAASRYQLLPTIDKWVTERALEMLAPYRSILNTREINVSINVSGQSICDELFVSQLAESIKAARLPASCLSIEITEQAAVTNLARASRLISELMSYGVQFALDDFGTGANSLSALKSLQISRVKIDGSFVREVRTDINSRATVRAVVELAAGLSIDTVAECVETQETAEELRALGVDFGQGYAFGRPEPLSDILSSLSADESRRMHRLFLES